MKNKIIQKHKAISTIIGTIIFLVLMVATFGALITAFQLSSDIFETQLDISDFENKKSRTARTWYSAWKEESTRDVHPADSVRILGPQISKDRQQARRVVEMEVTEHHIGHAGQLDPQRSRVLENGVRVPTGIEQHASPIDCNERR